MVKSQSSLSRTLMPLARATVSDHSPSWKGGGGERPCLPRDYKCAHQSWTSAAICLRFSHTRIWGNSGVPHPNLRRSHCLCRNGSVPSKPVNVLRQGASGFSRYGSLCHSFTKETFGGSYPLSRKAGEELASSLLCDLVDLPKPQFPHL